MWVNLDEGDDVSEFDTAGFVSVYGAEGDDVITYQSDAFAFDRDFAVSDVYGDAGNDIINIFATIPEEGVADQSQVRVSGGPGADTLEVTLEVMQVSDQIVPDISHLYSDGEGPSERPEMEIFFDPEEDELTINIVKIDGSLDLDDIAIAAVQNKVRYGVFETVFDFSFPETGQSEGSYSQIVVVSSAPFDADQIKLNIQTGDGPSQA